jgi:hypothetical protein
MTDDSQFVEVISVAKRTESYALYRQKCGMFAGVSGLAYDTPIFEVEVPYYSKYPRLLTSRGYTAKGSYESASLGCLHFFADAYVSPDTKVPNCIVQISSAMGNDFNYSYLVSPTAQVVPK